MPGDNADEEYKGGPEAYSEDLYLAELTKRCETSAKKEGSDATVMDTTASTGSSFNK
jgi:hypothetical protein